MALEKTAFPMPAWFKPDDIAWYMMVCPDCGQNWGVGRERGKPGPDTHCTKCGKNNVKVTQEQAGNMDNQKNNP